MNWKPDFFFHHAPAARRRRHGDAPAAASLACLLTAACAAVSGGPGAPDAGGTAHTHTGSPAVSEAAEQHGLVNLATFEPSILIDLRYAGGANVAGAPLYPQDMPCLVNRHTAGKLRSAQAALRRHGLGLKVWDAYRPPEVQRQLWNTAGRVGYVADPSKGWSMHCSGSAVDVTLVDRRGAPQKLPTGFDDFSEGAAYDSAPRGSIARRNVALLQHAMSDAGFDLMRSEWWHFNDPDGYRRGPVFAHQLGITLPVSAEDSD